MNKKKYSEKLRDPRWQKLRLEVLSRDNFCCRTCSDSTTELQVHHQTYHPSGNPWDTPADCLLTLCKDCHSVVEFLKSKGVYPETIQKKGEFSLVYYFDKTEWVVGIIERLTDQHPSHLISLSGAIISDIKTEIDRLYPCEIVNP